MASSSDSSPRQQISWLRIGAEGGVIVASVLLALGADAWWEDRNERRTELIILQEINAALLSDSELLGDRLQRLKQVADRTEALYTALRTDGPYADSLDVYFGSFFGAVGLQLNSAGYASLRSQGLGLISDPALRSKIAQVYETQYPRMLAAAESEREVVLGLQRPYLIEHFRDYRFNETAAPVDPETVWADQEFLNLLNYRLQAIRQSRIPVFERGIVEMGELMEMIKEEVE